jgi:hypothetical protein
MHGVDRVLQRLCDASATVGGIVLVAIASVTVVSVIVTYEYRAVFHYTNVERALAAAIIYRHACSSLLNS